VEPADIQPSLLRDEPATIGDNRWNTLLAALAEHLAARSAEICVAVFEESAGGAITGLADLRLG
jgi:hypothetical protein